MMTLQNYLLILYAQNLLLLLKNIPNSLLLTMQQKKLFYFHD